MERITHLLAPTAVLVLVLSIGVTYAGPSARTFLVEADKTSDMDLAGWARNRFDAAGLDLPAVVITFHDDRSPCRGNAGLYHPSHPVEVHLCLPAARPPAIGKLTILHELGHAWAETQATEQTRRRFLAVRNLDTWIDPEQPPHLWGAEHAAETISWALMDTPIPIIRIYHAEPEALAEAYEVLAKSEPLVPWKT